MTDLELMQQIHDRWGQVLATAAENTSLPENFLAALVANESGGKPNAERFETHVFVEITEVVTGSRADYNGIGAADLLGYLNKTVPLGGPQKSLLGLRVLASSWGLTQIMGWQSFRLGIRPEMLLDPHVNLSCASRLLASFAHSFGLDLGKDFLELFTCWNTGRPDGKTANPHYAATGLSRMQIYEKPAPPQAPPAPPTQEA